MSNTNGYRTKQREYILNYLLENKDKHITVDDVVHHLKQSGTAVGKTTVYRYLDVLVNQGIVRKYFIEEGISACFQYIDDVADCHTHYHLKCSDCGHLMHIECEPLALVNEDVLKHYHFKIDNTKTVLYGQCESCLNKH